MEGNKANPEDYILVGGEYYKNSRCQDDAGRLLIQRIPWSKWRLNLDFKSNPADKDLIPRYDAFYNDPRHIGYQRRIGEYYNCYEDIQIVPKPGSWETIRRFLEHLFGDMVEIIYDYLTILYKYPKHLLPILVLLSKEKQTGKTTFLNFLRLIFKGNVAMLTNDALRSKFNSDWAEKLLVLIDETLLSRREDSERLKAMSTAEHGTIEAKGKDRHHINTYYKFVMCSNNPDTPIWIEEDDDRYLVIDVPSLTKKIPGLLSSLEKEIPAFIHFLLNRQMKYPEPQERMWFPMKELETPALRRIKRACGPKGEIELAEAMLSLMEHYGVDKLEYTLKDLNELLKAFDIKLNGSVRDIVRKRWELEPAPSNMAYWHYNVCQVDEEVGGRNDKGRYYTFTSEFVEKILKEKDWKR